MSADAVALLLILGGPALLFGVLGIVAELLVALGLEP